MSTAQDAETIREAFRRARPNGEHARLYGAAVARRQADQIYNLSLTRTATVTLGREVAGRDRDRPRQDADAGDRLPAGAGDPGNSWRWRTSRWWRPGTPKAARSRCGMHRRSASSSAAGRRRSPRRRGNSRGPLGVRVEDKRQRPAAVLHDLPSLQKLCSTRFGWTASKTLEVAQELYDGEGKKILTYPRAEVRYLPESAAADAPKIVAGLRAGRAYADIPVPSPPAIRKGRNGAFHDKGLEGASHHAIVPNVNRIDDLREVWPRLTADEKKLFDAGGAVLPGLGHAGLPLPADHGDAGRAGGSSSGPPDASPSKPAGAAPFRTGGATRRKARRHRLCRPSGTGRLRVSAIRRSRTRRRAPRRVTGRAL